MEDTKNPQRWDFEHLWHKEHEVLKNEDEQPQVGNDPRQDCKIRTLSTLGSTEEPWVAFTTEDRVGLALSGGGIRSATFNLGLLQALQQNEVLKRVDYLSTVSGGGYIGGFWTRWRRAVRQEQTVRNPRDFPRDFPRTTGNADGTEKNGPKEIREPPEIRHLREFSRFLIPRKGLTTDFWSAAVTILSGLVPSLTAALAAVLFIMVVWAYLAAWMIDAQNAIKSVQVLSPSAWLPACITNPSPWGVAIFFTTLTLFALLVVVRIARKEVTEFIRTTFTWCYVIWAVVGSLLSLVGWLLWNLWQSAPDGGVRLADGEVLHDSQQYNFNHFLFGPCIALLVAVALLTLCRLFLDLFGKRSVALAKSLERVMGLLLALQVVWAALAGVWELARWLDVKASTAENMTGIGGLTAVLALLFYRVQRWLTQPCKEGSTHKLFEWLRPLAPQLLANAIVVLLFVLAAVFIRDLGLIDENWPNAWILVGCLIMLGLMLLLFDPMSVGLHEFYRARLTRCYLGASRPTDRSSVECPDDDMLLADDIGKPIHLICCAANHLCGDPLGTLHRGARSAVLSRHGIAIGNHFIMDKELRLSSAMTASAAAFNSLMGELNMTLGRAVAFVMTSLNLRLGLWVMNPAYTKHRQSPGGLFPWARGWFFIKEMITLAKCSAEKDAKPEPYVHLSDGGHFENLALYELIRRHCRYIIVADAGEDHSFAFSDFGRAVRRVREDFGVEIDIDLTPLKPGPDKLSRQHVVVGTIHYNCVVGTDKGTIVYFKPTLTGDEPVDLQQYRQRKPRFPHESTRDQFFDEAQWESYRRLGEHTGHASLRILEEEPLSDGLRGRAKQTQKRFREFRRGWQHVPWMEADAGVRLCEHVTALETALHEHACPALRKEFFGDMLSAASTASSTDRSARTATSGEEIAAEVSLVLRAFKLMEEAFVVCDLDSYWSHPRATGWMSYLQRWAAMPTLRHWWPLLKPMLGWQFQEFADRQLHLPTVEHGHQLKLIQFDYSLPLGFAWQRLQQCQPNFARRIRDCSRPEWFSLELTLPNSHGTHSPSIQVGLAIIGITGTVVSWHIDHLFVPPELRGGGFTTKLLDEVIKHYDQKKAGIQLEVTLEDRTSDATSLSRGQAERQEQIELIDFYRSRGFQFDNENGWNVDGQNTRMVLKLEHVPSSSTGGCLLEASRSS